MAGIRRLSDAIRDRIVRKWISKRTEEAYTGWALRFVGFHSRRHPTPTVRTFQAIVKRNSLVSAVQGPWRSADAPDGAAALLLKLSLRDDDTLEGALVAYDGPERLRFLPPFALTMRRATAEPSIE